MATRYGDARELAIMTSELSNRQVSIAQQRPDIDLLADYHSHITPPKQRPAGTRPVTSIDLALLHTDSGRRAPHLHRIALQ